MKKQKPLASHLILASLATAGIALAGDPSPPMEMAPTPPAPAQSGDGWWFRMAPYGWLTAVEGDVNVGHLSAPVDVTMSDTLENIDFTYMGIFEMGYDRWSLGVDVIYAKFSQDIDAGGRIFDSFRAEQKQWLITPAVSYRLIDTDSYHMSVFAGARVTVFEVGLTGRFVGGGQTTANADTSWVDPIVGVRGQYDISDRWFIRYNGDIGGFGVSSDLTWNAFAGLGYNFTQNASVAFGYRGLGIDYSEGNFGLDIITHGPVLGFELRF